MTPTSNPKQLEKLKQLPFYQNDPFPLTQKELQNILEIFKTAPGNFYSPTGREILTIDEIETRKGFGSFFSNIAITKKEIVFRKFWELLAYPENERFQLAHFIWSFIVYQGIWGEDIISVVAELQREIEIINEAKGRTIYNPL
jgi:hypothetical protein